MVAEHGLLIVQRPGQEPPIRVIPERKVGQQIDQNGQGHEEHQAEQYGLPCAGPEALEDVGMGDAAAHALRVLSGDEVFPVSPVQRPEENQR